MQCFRVCVVVLTLCASMCGGMAKATDLERLGEQYVECFKAHLALFKPKEVTPDVAKAYARARSRLLGIPTYKTYTVNGKTSSADSIAVTWAFIGQEDYRGGLMDPTGKIQIKVEIENYSSTTLKVLFSESGLVDDDGNSFSIMSLTSSASNKLRPQSKATYDIVSYVKDEYSTLVMLVTSFKVYIDIGIGGENLTLTQEFDRIPWAKGEPSKTK